MLVIPFLFGCASTTNDKLYYDAVKSISKDNTVAQTACWAAISEIAKNGDSNSKLGAIMLVEKCKIEPLRINSPKNNWLGQ